MMQFKIHTEQGKQVITAPTSWSELNVDQFIQVQNCKTGDVMKMFSIITGLDVEVAENSTDKSLEENIWKIVQFVNQEIDWERISSPTHYEVDGKVYKLPKKFGTLMTGQKIMMSQTIQKVEDMINEIPKIIAIILMPQYTKDGKFDSSLVDELTDKVRHSAGIDGYGIAKGFFLLSNHLKNYGLSDLKKYLDQRTPTKKISKKWLTSNDLNRSPTCQ